jgi:transketolase
MATTRREATRDGYGRALLKLARRDPNVVAIDCDLGRSTRSFDIIKVDPTRFIEMGISEQDMISTAAGMATLGKTVFVNSFAVFLTGRAFDQIRQQVSLPISNVKICGSSAGITQGPDGATHQSVIDIALMRALPNMTVLIPADGAQAEEAVFAAYSRRGPIYLRLSRYETGDFLPPGTPFEIGKPQVLRKGGKVVLLSCGPVLINVIAAADLLQMRGIFAGIVNFHTLKPIDRTLLERLAHEYSHIISIEEHSIYGGLGSAAAEVLAETGLKGSVLHRLGVQDVFGESGTADELLKKHKLDPEGIADSVYRVTRNMS